MDLPDTLNVFVKLTEKFLEALEKKVSTQNMKNEAQNQVKIFWQNLVFWAETFFQVPLTRKIFCKLYDNVQGIWEVRLA